MKTEIRHKSSILLALLCLVGVILVISIPDGGSCRQKVQIREETVMDAVSRIPSVDSVIYEKVLYPYEHLTLTETEFSCRGRLNHMFVFQVDLGHGLNFRPCSPDNLPIDGTRQDILLQAQAAEKAGVHVLYGINADVFGGYRSDLQGLSVPMGVLYVDGKPYQDFYHENAENVFYVTRNGHVKIERYDQFESELKKVKHAVGAWHTLVWDGQPATVPDDILGQGFHPRTFIGLTRDCNTAYVFVVDGRQPGWSEGLQMQDMIDICLATGCDRAVNLDGGGSTTLVARNPEGFVVMNRPSDEGNVLRPVVDGLLIVKE